MSGGSSPRSIREVLETFPRLAVHYCLMTPDSLSLGGYLMEPNDFQVADLNGDGSDEWLMRIITITDPQSIQSWGPPGSILLVDPAAGAVVYEAKSEQWNSPTLLPVEDFTGDGLQEMLYYMNSCGAHTCIQEYDLISFHYEGPPSNLLINPESELAVGISYSLPSTDERTGVYLMKRWINGSH